MNLKTYLMEWDPKRFQQARDEKILDDPRSKTAVVTPEIPDWLIEDADRYEEVFFHTKDVPGYKDPREEFSNIEIRNKLINFLKQKRGVRDWGKVPSPATGVTRFVVTINGDIFWVPSGGSIHQDLIAYGMLVGKIPQDDWLSNYKWSEPGYYEEGFEQILCLEKYAPTWGPIVLAESYKMGTDIISTIAEMLSQLPDTHPYAIAIEKLGSSIDEVTSKYFQ